MVCYDFFVITVCFLSKLNKKSSCRFFFLTMILSQTIKNNKSPNVYFLVDFSYNLITVSK